MWPRAVPIPPACDNPARLAFLDLSSSAPTSNAQRSTSTGEMTSSGNASASLAGDGASPSRTSLVRCRTPGMSAESFGGAPKGASEVLTLPGTWGSLARARILAQPLLHVHDVFGRRFVDRADNGARDRELDHCACDPAGQDFER